ncbi:PREDICTED: fatty acid synthase-like [Wasmannia auropunctata]|uniref:fatty acid synthase-like n=1 Tax=Wasmannia auropunctata TaxID=64793 RepID=UPI0005EEF873|nr:PREDICTED: fatty acid synthase-like [Wasmannia auropunctata]
MNGTVRVIEEAMPIKNGYVGINAFGFGGANAHMLLKWNQKQKVNNSAPDDDLPRLVILSGRTKESVELFLNDIANYHIDVEYIRLLNDVHADNIDGHPWRGYIILNTLQQYSMKEIQNCNNVKRPVCFIFSALGSQWSGMGQKLLKFQIFANAIRMCDTVLKPYGVSVTDILTRKDKKVFKNALYTFLGIVAVQVGLVDLLTSLEIIPDYMIGHSAGELGCAYADKCLTIKQTILSAYFIGLACTEKNIIHSSMAVVSLDYESLKNICSTDIEIVCHNSDNNSIVSGPAESVQKFIKKLQVNNIYVKKIHCNVPYHSSYLASVESQLLSNLNKIILRPKKRSLKWISTSIPRAEWHTLASKLSSADYHTRSILNTVFFEQARHLIPSNAVTIEIAPYGVLQQVLEESLSPEVTNISLTPCIKLNDDDVIFQGIGKLYNCGLQPKIANLYPPVTLPVSRGTPMISPSIRWNHSEDWFVPNFEDWFVPVTTSRERSVEILVDNEEYKYISGHVIDGRNLLPATGYLALVWQTIGMIKERMYTTIPIVFQDVNFIRATQLFKNKVVKLTISIQKGGKFEITEGDSVVVTGIVHETPNLELEMTPTDLLPENNDEEEHMTARDIYKELKLRGYQYSDLFRGLQSASISGRKGHIIWKNNWATFIDNMLQMHIFGYDTRNLYVPTNIQKLAINPELHAMKLQDADDLEATINNDKQLPIRVYKELDTIIAGGIEIRGIKASQINRRKLAQDAVIEEHIFIAHYDRAEISLNEAIRISAQLVLEDHQIIKVKAIELVEDDDDISLEYLSSSLLIEAFNDMPLIQTNITLLTSPNRFNSSDLQIPQNISIADLNKAYKDDNVLIVAGFNLLTKRQTSLERLMPFLKEGGYLLTREKCDVTDYTKYLQQYELNVILEKRTDKETIVLLKRKVLIEKRIVVYINNNNFNWLEDLKSLVSDENKLEKNSRIIIVGEKDLECGLLGFMNCLRKEPGGEFVRSMFIQDKEAPKFSLQNSFYLEQLQKDMTVNVLRPNETWGSYRHLRLPQLETKPVPTAHVYQRIRGDLSTFCWIENNRSVEFRRENLVYVIYSSLNFRDVMITTGKLVLNHTISLGRLFQYMPLGLEYVGFDINGQRVMGLNDTDCIANVVVKDKYFQWKIPDAWTFEEAATVPCVYSTVYLALYIYGKMKKGDKILIHSGTGGIGQFSTNYRAMTRILLSKKQLPHTMVTSSLEKLASYLAKDKLQIMQRGFCNLSAEHFDLLTRKGVFPYEYIDCFEKLEDTHLPPRESFYSSLTGGAVSENDYAHAVNVWERFSIRSLGEYSDLYLKTDVLLLADIFENFRDSCVASYGLDPAHYYTLPGFTWDAMLKYTRIKFELLTDIDMVMFVERGIRGSLSQCSNRYARANNKHMQSYDPSKPSSYLMYFDVNNLYGWAMCQPLPTLANNEFEKNLYKLMNNAVFGKTMENVRNHVDVRLLTKWEGYDAEAMIAKPNFHSRSVFSENLVAIEMRKLEVMVNKPIYVDGKKDTKKIEGVKSNVVAKMITFDDYMQCLLDETEMTRKQSCIRSKLHEVYTISEKKIALNLKDVKLVSRNAALAELGMDSMMAVEIKQTLEREFDIFLTAQEIRNLTFAKLMNMSDGNVSDDTIHNKKKLDTEESNMGYLFGILKNEDFISQTCFDLPTKREKATTEVFLIPGIDGCVTVFNRLAPDIKFSAMALHYNTNNIDSTTNVLSETTDHLTNHILPKLRDGKDFVIVGYSFGAIIAFELTKKLEAMNFKGRLVLIDGAPEQIRIIYKHFVDFDDADLQIATLTNIMEIYTAGSSEKILMELKECNTWEERYNIFAKQFLAVNTVLSPANLKMLCLTFYKHLSAIRQYDPSTLLPIKSPIILLKPTNTMHISKIEEDYGLQKITENVVKVHCIEGTHTTILKNKEVIAAINGDPPFMI